ncbi:MAG TPA: glucokinase [Rhizobacter sp.]|nr:glucokinase [Rhizobacter sp.]
MAAPTFPRWVADIGGTNARFAWQADAQAALSDLATYATADYPTLQDAMRRYLSDQGKTVPPWCAMGIATPIGGDLIQMTNHPWSFSVEGLRRELGLERLLFINDFTALALSLPSLVPSELRQVGSGQAVAGAPLGLIGPGTGLGVSGLLTSAAGRLVPIVGEGGHVTLGGTSSLEDAVIAALRTRFGHVSAERALSGPGLVNLYSALCLVEGTSAKQLTPAEVTQWALAGSDTRCVATVDLFFSLLGTVAGNLAVTLGARGGLYIGGGIVPRLGDWIDRSSFRERFAGKGRFRNYLQALPTYVLLSTTSPALVGALRALDDL